MAAAQSIANHNPKITAHRVNSLARLHEVLEIGVDGIEFDVQMSKDGVLFLYHDCQREGIEHECFINQMDWGVIKQKDPDVPTLEEFLIELSKHSLPKGFILHTELKSPDDGLAGKTITLLRKYKLFKRSVLRSFLPEQIIDANDQGARTCLLFGNGHHKQQDIDYKVEDFIHVTTIPSRESIIERLGFAPETISIHYSTATPDVVKRLKSEGFSTCCYTINPEKDNLNLDDETVRILDSVITDDPACVRKCLQVSTGGS
jgi:glycerophosphoryl diester phosphodiesterase